MPNYFFYIISRLVKQFLAATLENSSKTYHLKSAATNIAADKGERVFVRIYMSIPALTRLLHIDKIVVYKR